MKLPGVPGGEKSSKWKRSKLLEEEEGSIDNGTTTVTEAVEKRRMKMNKNRNIPIFLQKQDNPKFSLKYIANKTKVLFLCTKFGLLRP